MSRDLGGGGRAAVGMDPAITQMDRLATRLVRLEEALDQLIETHNNLMVLLADRGDSRKRKEMPSPNTKYYEFLVYLNDNFSSSEFTSDEIPRQSRHILSILNTEYSSLDVVSKRGRTNVYRISPDVRKKLKKAS
jgi:hypothetical protein